MDHYDVSEFDHFRSQLEKAQNNANRASQRKGQKPQDYPSPLKLITEYMSIRASILQVSIMESSTVTAVQIPAQYYPSIRSVDELEQVMVSGMMLQDHHRGKKVIVCVSAPPYNMTATTAIVEDEEGTPVLIQLYNQSQEAGVNAEDILQQQGIYLIKEPFFNASRDGSYTLRVDHVSDIIPLPQGDERIPQKWQRPVNEGSHELRMLGNTAVQKKNWAEAELLYSAAISTAKTPEEQHFAYLNRSLAHLKLGRREKALSDASKGCESGKPSEKLLFREARALYELAKYKPSLEKLQLLVRSHPENKDAWSEIKRANERIREEETGEYQFSEMFKQAEATPPIIDCATHVGPVAVLDSPGCGKGLFTTKAVKAGDLLFCEKAFAYIYADGSDAIGRSHSAVLMNLNTNKCIMGGLAHLITQIIQKLYHDPESSGVFTDLHHGDYEPVAVSEVDGQPVVDSCLVERIVSLNSFGAPRASLKNVENDNRKRTAHPTCGIWLLASRINHACLANCHRAFIGDMLVVRASQDLDAGTELRFSYAFPAPHETYDEIQAKLSPWGFTCNCARCVDVKSTPMAMIQQRERLRRAVEKLLDTDKAIAQVWRAQALLNKLQATYATSESESEETAYRDIWDLYISLGTVRSEKDQPAKAVAVSVKGLEALGYKVEAYLSTNDDAEERKFEIERWGQPVESAMRAFIQIFEAYQKLAPELCAAVRQCAAIAFSICFGDDGNFGAMYPEFA
ncbi:TPR domain protein [Xylariaceae sp. FL0662B]|nr:TPR domain protein [Xylariaceae sp. FL0662B]